MCLTALGAKHAGKNAEVRTCVFTDRTLMQVFTTTSITEFSQEYLIIIFLFWIFFGISQNRTISSQGNTFIYDCGAKGDQI